MWWARTPIATGPAAVSQLTAAKASRAPLGVTDGSRSDSRGGHHPLWAGIARRRAQFPLCGNPHIKLRNHLGLLANHLSPAGSAQRQSRLFDHVLCASRERRQHIEPEALAVVTRPQGPLPTNRGGPTSPPSWT